MNKKDVSVLRKQFKEDSFIDFRQTFSVFIKKENQEVLSLRSNEFRLLNDEEQDIFVKNFKKTLIGKLNAKLFQLNFNNEGGRETEEVLSQMIMTNNQGELEECIRYFVDKIRENYVYDTDILVNFIKFNYNTEEDVYPFVMCSVNKMKKNEKELMFDYINRSFDIKRELNPIINMKSPTDGFLYPLFEDGRPNVGGLLNYHSKNNKTNSIFITNVLDCELVLTAKEEKNAFQEILRTAIGDQVEPDLLYELYSTLNNYFETEEDEEYRKIPRTMLERVLNEIGVEVEELTDAYLEVLNTDDYSFKANNVIPDFRDKSIKISNAEAEVTFSPEGLDKVKQVRDEEGRLFLLMEITEKMRTENFDMAVDNIQKIKFEE